MPAALRAPDRWTMVGQAFLPVSPVMWGIQSWWHRHSCLWWDRHSCPSPLSQEHERPRGARMPPLGRSSQTRMSMPPSAEKINAPRGTADLLPAETWKWQTVERIARELATVYHF